MSRVLAGDPKARLDTKHPLWAEGGYYHWGEPEMGYFLSKDEYVTVRVHRMASPAHDKAIRSLLADLTKIDFRHPQTGARLIYELV